MGLRYRKSVQICKGVRLNFSKTGVSISAGVPGFRKNYNLTTGRSTTTYSIPGTGISYVDTKSSKKRTASNSSPIRDAVSEMTSRWREEKTERESKRQSASIDPRAFGNSTAPRTASERMAERERLAALSSSESYAESRIEEKALSEEIPSVCIHFGEDDPVDWIGIAENRIQPTRENKEALAYYRAQAAGILDGDIDTYLQVLDDLNPFDDLMEYGMEFACGTDDARSMAVEFAVNSSTLSGAVERLPMRQYQELYQDFVCSCAIRAARDIFALLPVQTVIVSATEGERVILSVRFPRKRLSGMQIEGSDASELVQRFENNMEFSPERGFQTVEKIEE